MSETFKVGDRVVSDALIFRGLVGTVESEADGWWVKIRFTGGDATHIAASALRHDDPPKVGDPCFTPSGWGEVAELMEPRYCESEPGQVDLGDREGPVYYGNIKAHRCKCGQRFCTAGALDEPPRECSRCEDKAKKATALVDRLYGRYIEIALREREAEVAAAFNFEPWPASVAGEAIAARASFLAMDADGRPGEGFVAYREWPVDPKKIASIDQNDRIVIESNPDAFALPSKPADVLPVDPVGPWSDIRRIPLGERVEVTSHVHDTQRGVVVDFGGVKCIDCDSMSWGWRAFIEECAVATRVPVEPAEAQPDPLDFDPPVGMTWGDFVAQREPLDAVGLLLLRAGDRVVVSGRRVTDPDAPRLEPGVVEGVDRGDSYAKDLHIDVGLESWSVARMAAGYFWHNVWLVERAPMPERADFGCIHPGCPLRGGVSVHPKGGGHHHTRAVHDHHADDRRETRALGAEPMRMGWSAYGDDE